MKYANRLVCERPLAQQPLTSYRYQGNYGWIMIGATDQVDAMIQVNRSGSYKDVSKLQVWDNALEQYRTITNQDK
jgi:hypothetical protein